MSARARIVSTRALVLAALAAGALVALHLASGASETAPLAATPAPAAAAEQRTYALRYEGQTRAVVVAGARRQPIEGRLVLDGTLAWTQLADGRALVELLDLGEARLELAGSTLLEGPAQAAELLLGTSAVLEYGEGGRLALVSFDAGAPPLFGHVMRHLAAELSWPLAESGAVRTAHGEATLAVAAEGVERQVTLSGYTRVDGAIGEGLEPEVRAEALVGFDEQGALARLASDERLVVRDGEGAERYTASGTLTLVLLERRPLAAEPEIATRDGLQRHLPGEVRPSAGMRERMLESRVDGLTAAQLREDLLRQGLAGDPDHDWLWRASGLLLLQPELAHELAELYDSEVASPGARDLIVDLLASVGHPDAQAALLDALGSGRALGPALARHLVRLGHLDAPTAETRAWVRQRFESAADPAVAAVSAAVLGQLVGVEAERGGDPLALLEPLVERAETVEDPAQRQAILTGLGNSRLPEALPFVEAAASDADEGVRRVAARALRRFDAPEARRQLSALAGDASPAVRRTALSAMSELPPGPDLARAVASAVDAGALHEGQLKPALQVLARAGEGADPETRALILGALDQMAAMPLQLPGLRDRILQLRRSLQR